MDIFDQTGSLSGAIALPQLVAGGAVIRDEEDPIADAREAAGARIGGTGVDISHEHRALGGAVAAPQFEAVVVNRAEEHAFVERDEFQRR